MLDRQAILGALRALDDELGRRGIRANLFVVGGAAMAIAYDARRTTADVDAIFAPATEVRNAAAAVADELGLTGGWLDDGAKAFMPGDDPGRLVVFEGSNVQVAAASPRYPLAMKLLAARVERDRDDIRELYRLCGFRTAAEGIALLRATYPEREIPPRSRFMLEEMFPTRELRQDPARERDQDSGLDLGF